MPSALLLLALWMSAPPARSAEALRDAEIQASKAFAAWEAKAYVRAAEYFLAAFELSGEPTQLRNAAKAFEAAGAREEARASWARLLELPDLDAEDQREAEERALALSAETITATVVEAPPEPPAVEPAIEAPPIEARVEPPPPEPEPDRPVRWEPWVLAGAGVAAAAAGGVVWGVGAGDLAELREELAVTEDGKIIGIQRHDALAEEQRIEGMRIGSALAMGAGIAALLAGLSWWWFDW